MAFQIPMLQFVCDYCGNVRQIGEPWLNGLAAEHVGTKAARREVIIDPTWRSERAILPFAVHFCSVQCKDSYLSELFNQPAQLLEVERVKVSPETGRAVRARKRPAKEVVQKQTRVAKRTRIR